jgi:hypothetical protein
MSSAINPAATDWLDVPGRKGITVAPYYSGICFEKGTWLGVYGESLTMDTHSIGTLQPAMAQIRSNRNTDRFGRVFDYRVDTMLLQWGKRFGSWGIGACFNFNEAEVVQKLGGLRISESNAESYRFRVGALWEPADKWLVGLVAEYGFAPYRAEATAVIPFFGVMQFKSEGTAHQFVLRPGISYEYAEHSTVFLDYQFGAFFTDEDRIPRAHTERMNSHRFSAGVNHRLLDWLFIQGGASVDVRGNFGFTAGCNIFFSENISLSLGYQYHVLPELRPELGQAQVLQATLSFAF